MSDNDDLGDFFAEIQQIEAAPEDSLSISNAVANQVIVNEPEKVVITSAPPVLNVSQNHAVYTYDFGDYGSQEVSSSSSISKDNKNITDMSHYTTIKPSSSSSSSSSFNQQSTAQVNNVPVPSISSQNQKFVRTGAGEVWIDDTLKEWPENDFRIFVGDLAKEVTTDHLTKHFQQYKSFAKAKVRFCSI